VELARDRRIRTLLPDALTSSWDGIGGELRKAIKSPPAGARQLSVFDAYAGTPLWKKLGIKPAGRIVAVNGPSDLGAILAELPEDAVVKSSGPRDLTLWFVKSRTEVDAKIRSMARFAAAGGLWIIWRKGEKHEESASQPAVRRAGLACGLVDFKIASIDTTWSGLRFTRRKVS
jgi:hypothetical protein